MIFMELWLTTSFDIWALSAEKVLRKKKEAFLEIL